MHERLQIGTYQVLTLRNTRRPSMPRRRCEKRQLLAAVSEVSWHNCTCCSLSQRNHTRMQQPLGVNHCGGRNGNVPHMPNHKAGGKRECLLR